MPSQSYGNTHGNYESPIKTVTRDDFSYPSQADSLRRRALENANYLGTKAFRQSPKEKEESKKHYQKNLKRLQKNSPKLAAGLAKGKTSAIAAFSGGLFNQIDWSVDWLFLLLGSFAFLKDILDIAFAITGTALTALLGFVPIAGGFFGAAATAIGMTISFAGDLMFLILTVTVLLYVGSSLKNRGMAKYFIGMAMEFIAEALPGISWLPWTVIYVFILYFCVLYDRMMNKEEKVAA